MSQCPKTIDFGRRLTLYCQGEEGHDGEHTPPPMGWREIVRLGGKEGTDPARRGPLRRRGAGER